MLEKVQIKAMKNGPLVIEGKAEITDKTEISMKQKVRWLHSVDVVSLLTSRFAMVHIRRQFFE